MGESTHFGGEQPYPGEIVKRQGFLGPFPKVMGGCMYLIFSLFNSNPCLRGVAFTAKT
jgi:hypothetical protein